MESSEDSSNPYAPAPSLAEPETTYVQGIDVRLIKDFHSQLAALGAFWIVIGAILAYVLVFSFVRTSWPPQWLWLAILILCMMIAWVICGIVALMHRMIGVRVGLAITYLVILHNLVQGIWCGVVVLGVMALQAHRVLSFAKRMRQHGLPLNFKV